MARSSLLLSLIGAASLSAALMAGCGDNDAKPTSSAIGESCVRTSDCADGLTCIGNTCYKGKPPSSTGGEGGDMTVAPVPPKLGGEGESCTSRLDCEEGLGCFNQRCTTPPTTTPVGEGGAPSTSGGLELGARGETCRVNGDCAKDLICVPSSTSNGVGVCDLAQYGLVPTGKKCGGECLTATDCCELPIALQTPTIKSCKDIDASITLNAIDCTAPTPLGQTLCFEQATYCTGCSAKTWDCTANKCVYIAACAAAAPNDTVTGCPTLSRLGTPTGVTCSAAKKCEAPGATAACTTDASCATLPVFDRAFGTADVCSAGECTCYAGNHECYRKCARDIECGGGTTCDTKAHVCVAAPTCSTNEQCAVKFASLDYECNKGACAKVCTVDRDCSPSGHGVGAPGFSGSVCGADGFCASIATDCADDSQCAPPPLFAGATPTLRTFCIAAPAAAASGAVSSAISD